MVATRGSGPPPDSDVEWDESDEDAVTLSSEAKENDVPLDPVADDENDTSDSGSRSLD